jgi:hypothetical protein
VGTKVSGPSNEPKKGTYDTHVPQFTLLFCVFLIWQILREGFSCPFDGDNDRLCSFCCARVDLNDAGDFSDVRALSNPCRPDSNRHLRWVSRYSGIGDFLPGGGHIL